MKKNLELETDLLCALILIHNLNLAIKIHLPK
jgi:hypothetical protein